eukprot:3079773-Prymnesium_polylepis.2
MEEQPSAPSLSNLEPSGCWGTSFVALGPLGCRLCRLARLACLATCRIGIAIEHNGDWLEEAPQLVPEP